MVTFSRPKLNEITTATAGAKYWNTDALVEPIMSTALTYRTKAAAVGSNPMYSIHVQAVPVAVTGTSLQMNGMNHKSPQNRELVVTEKEGKVLNL